MDQISNVTNLSSIRIVRGLCTRGSVHINNDVEPGVASPSTKLLKIGNSPLWEVLAVGLNNTLHHPVAYWNPNGVQSVTLHLRDVTLRNPCAPVILKDSIGLGLAQTRNTIKFRCVGTAAHARPCTFRDPRLEYEEGAKVDTTYFARGWKPSLRF